MTLTFDLNRPAPTPAEPQDAPLDGLMIEVVLRKALASQRDLPLDVAVTAQPSSDDAEDDLAYATWEDAEWQ